MQTKVRLKLGHEQALSSQGVVSLIFVASKIFGGASSGGGSAKPVRNGREARASWNRLMRPSKGG